MATIVKMMANSSVVLITTCNEGVIVSNKRLEASFYLLIHLQPQNIFRLQKYNWRFGGLRRWCFLIAKMKDMLRSEGKSNLSLAYS